jgi:hypothetical protein
MPTVVLVVLCVLGYVAMGVLTGTAFAFFDNRRHKEPMTEVEAGQLAFFSVFWPVLLVFIAVCGVFEGVYQTCKGYARYLRHLGAPKDDGMIRSP